MVMEIKNHDQILEEVSNACINLVVMEPFFGHFFQGIHKVVHDRVQTMAIGPSGTSVKLHINPKFWSTEITNKELRYGLVKHEILHVVFKHIFRSGDFRHKDIFNIACDLVVNQYIKVQRLPENRVHLGLFPDLKLEPERECDYYYKKLLDLYDKMTMKGEGSAGEGGQKIRGEGGAEDNQQPESPQDGSSESWENLKKMLGESNPWQDKHGLWEELENLPTSVKDIIEQAVDQSIESSLERIRRDQKKWGEMPGGLRSYLAMFEAERKPVVNWKRLLRIFAESSRRTFLRNTIRRPSKRYGTTPGIRVRKHQRLQVVVDTSGSVSQEDLREFFSEIYHIWKRGAEITIVECDSEITNVYPYRGKMPRQVTGRGGTNFTPPIRYANEECHPDAVIYFTDGIAPAPELRSRYPLLWLICSSGAQPGSNYFDNLPGKKISMEMGRN